VPFWTEYLLKLNTLRSGIVLSNKIESLIGQYFVPVSPPKGKSYSIATHGQGMVFGESLCSGRQG